MWANRHCDYMTNKSIPEFPITIKKIPFFVFIYMTNRMLENRKPVIGDNWTFDVETRFVELPKFWLLRIEFPLKYFAHEVRDTFAILVPIPTITCLTLRFILILERCR